MSWMSRSATSGGSRGALTLPGGLEQGLNFFERVDRWQRALVSPLSLLSLLSPADHLHRADPQSGCPSAVCRVVVGEQGGLRVHAELVQRDLVDLSRRLGHPDLVGEDQGVGQRGHPAFDEQIACVLVDRKSTRLKS